MQRVILAISKGENLLKKMHETLSHPGPKRMYMSLNKMLKIKNLKEMCRLIAKNCIGCNREKIGPNRTMRSTGCFHTTTPGDDICADIY